MCVRVVYQYSAPPAGLGIMYTRCAAVCMHYVCAVHVLIRGVQYRGIAASAHLCIRAVQLRIRNAASVYIHHTVLCIYTAEDGICIPSYIVCSSTCSAMLCIRRRRLAIELLCGTVAVHTVRCSMLLLCIRRYVYTMLYGILLHRVCSAVWCIQHTTYYGILLRGV